MALLAIWAPPARATEATLVADAHVSSDRPTVNCGALSNLNVGAGYTALVQFDLGLLPAGTTPTQVSRAVLRLYVNRMDTAGTLTVQPVNTTWDEGTVTYATLPTLGGMGQTASIVQPGAYVALDVTAQVQSWISAPETNHGLALTAGGAVLQLDSKENDQTAHPAALDITLVSQGPTGLAGATGPAGIAGPQGPVGQTGAQGPIGPMGPAGASGSGIQYQGDYSHDRNYAMNDVVIYGESSYLSLAEQNHGNTPNVSPQWGLLAQGGTGPMGPQGSPGLTYQGAYQSTVNYGIGDVAFWQGTSYTSLIAANHGNTPDASSAYWGVLSQRGATGATGATGAGGPQGVQGLPGSMGPPGERGPQGLQGIAGQAGAQGLTGPQGVPGLSGPMGPQGSAGPVGMTYRGAYQSTTNYGLADGVSWQGASYVSLIAGNAGNTPDQSPAAWSLFAAAGSPGVAGPQGPVGATGTVGAMGPQGPIGATGAQGAIGPVGPVGAMGPQGAVGAMGAPGVNFRGAWSSVTTYQVSDTVLFGGSSFYATVSTTGLQPDQYPSTWSLLAQAGSVGPTGAAATVAVGTVSTGAAGTQASVTNRGTSTAAVLDFVLPQGTTGASGGGGGGSGGQTLSGLPFVSTYHAVSYNALYYGVNSSASSYTENAGITTWVPTGCAANRLVVFSQQENSITLTLRVGPSLAGMIDSGLACTVATGNTCTGSGSVSIAAGSLVDFRVTGASGNMAGVWTAVECD